MQVHNYITLQEASNLVPFDANYLGLLIRNGRLFGVKKKGRWHTTKESLDVYMKSSARIGTVAKKKKQTRFPMVEIGLGAALFVALVFGIVVANDFFAGAKEENSVSKDAAMTSSAAFATEEDLVSSALTARI